MARSKRLILAATVTAVSVPAALVLAAPAASAEPRPGHGTEQTVLTANKAQIEYYERLALQQEPGWFSRCFA
jgi:hypothetical protein